MAKYQVLSPIRTAEGIVKEGYVEVPDAEVEQLTKLGAIGEVEPTPVQKGKATPASTADTPVNPSNAAV